MHCQATRSVHAPARVCNHVTRATLATLARPQQCRTSRGRLVCLAADPAAEAPGIVQRLKDDMKAAMKAKEQVKLDAIRFLNAALKSREIELRESGGSLTEAEAIKVLQKSAKQRRDSIESYKAGGRQDLVDKEATELALIESYLPAMMSASEVEAVVAAAVAETGASSVKDMGKVMGLVKARTEGRAEPKMLSDLVKAKLSGGGK